MGKELFQPFGKRSLLEPYSRLCPSLSERIGRAKTGTLQKRLCIESSPPTPASWGTESRLRFLDFTTFRSAVDTADSANSPCTRENWWKTWECGGPGEIRTPDHAASKGFPRVRRTFCPGHFLTGLNYRPTEKEPSGVFR